jgi:hypothetical protein
VSRRGAKALRRALGLGLALAGLSLASAAAAQEAPPPAPEALPERTATIALEDTTVKLSVSYRDAVDAAIAKRLLSGLPTVVVLRGFLLRDGQKTPMALVVKTCRVVYDLWDEVFRIQLTQSGSGASSAVAVNVEGVLRHCAELRRATLVPRSLLRDDARYFLAALVEVNPVSAEMLDRIQRWVTRPNGAKIDPGDTLFGSFVGLFVTRIGDADRKLAFRTQSFAPPVPPPPKPAPAPAR